MNCSLCTNPLTWGKHKGTPSHLSMIRTSHWAKIVQSTRSASFKYKSRCRGSKQGSVGQVRQGVPSSRELNVQQIAVAVTNEQVAQQTNILESTATASGTPAPDQLEHKDSMPCTDPSNNTGRRSIIGIAATAAIWEGGPMEAFLDPLPRTSPSTRGPNSELSVSEGHWTRGYGQAAAEASTSTGVAETTTVFVSGATGRYI